MTEIKYIPFREWQGGQSNGYYEPDTDTISVLQSVDLELRTVFHEQAHASRRNKLSFKLASLLANPITNLMFVGILAVFAVAAFINFAPFIVCSSFYLLLYFLHTNEENIANRTANKRLRDVLA